MKWNDVDQTSNFINRVSIAECNKYNQKCNAVIIRGFIIIQQIIGSSCTGDIFLLGNESR